MDQIQNAQEDKLQRSTFMSFWYKLILLIVGMATFVFMMWFIWFFPGKVSHKKQDNSIQGEL